VSNSLRSALNYLTARLFELDAGTKGTHVQFPIESTPHKFKRQRDRYLRGISEVHVAAIERLQPYNGNEWATNLQRLSNLHKHDDLVIVAHDYLLGGNRTVSKKKNPNVQRFTMRMNIKPALRIALGDGLPVVEALEVIQGQVAQTLDAFKLEF